MNRWPRRRSPTELVVPASSLLAGASIMAPPSGPNPAGDIPILDTTTVDRDRPACRSRCSPRASPPVSGRRPVASRTLAPNAAIATAARRPGARRRRRRYRRSAGLGRDLRPGNRVMDVDRIARPRPLGCGGRGPARRPDPPDRRHRGIDGAPGDHALDSVEIYDVATGRWSTGAALGEARTHATTTVLDDGSVLIAGGLGPDGSLATAERYDPAEGRWHTVGSLATARGLASASLLADGRVLVAGGLGTTDADRLVRGLRSGHRDCGTRSPTCPVASMLDTATTLADGRVLVAGSDARGKLYDPGTDSWSWTGALGTVRTQATAVTLPDGDVLLIGGTAAGQVETDAEIYDAATNTWQSTTVLPTGTASAAAVVLPDGSVLAVGGADRTTPLAAASSTER